MKKLLLNNYFLVLTFFFSALSKISGQEEPKKSVTIFDIPHETSREKWMWPHRSIAFSILKERKKNYDTTYIKSYSKKFIVTIPVSARLMHFDLINPKNTRYLQFTPNYRYDVGIGISSRWATFITNTGIVFFNAKNNERGVTRYNDFQLNLFGKRFTSDIVYQYYRGFYIANAKDFEYNGSGAFKVRSDVNATLFTNSTYFIFNHTKFSYRNSFTFTEKQLKSCGSFLLGPYYSLFGVTADSNLISPEFAPVFDSLETISEGSVQNFGISAGYIYTFVKEKAYATISIVPGIGLVQTTYDRVDGSKFRSQPEPSAKSNFRLGIGYDTGTLFIGAMGVYDYFYNFNGKSNTFNFSTGKAMAYIGYRFRSIKTERKILKKLKLIDYPGDPRNK